LVPACEGMGGLKIQRCLTEGSFLNLPSMTEAGRK